MLLSSAQVNPKIPTLVQTMANNFLSPAYLAHPRHRQRYLEQATHLRRHHTCAVEGERRRNSL